MKPEQLDTYVIPPNFIEGGTLMGGMFKTRNAIEAAILGAAIGLPVFHLGLSLTTRIILLILTALPAAIFALIGIDGLSLSSFAAIFILYLRNRRLLTRSYEENEKKRKSIHPKGAVQTEPVEALPRSRQRFQVDFKGKKVQEYKVFLAPEEQIKPLNALAEYVPVEKIINGVIYTRDHR